MILRDSEWPMLEIHLFDLDIGVTYGDWPEEFVTDRLCALRPSVTRRLPAGAPTPPEGALTEREELAWIFGSLDPPGFPRLDLWE